jgi:hypothetical protein
MELSGVDPPNLEDFQWAAAMGLEEAALHLHAAIVLEEAIGSGRLTPAHLAGRRLRPGSSRSF